MDKKHSLAELKDLPTLQQSHTDKKKMVEGTKQVVVNAPGFLAVRLNRFRTEERGDAMQWEIGIGKHNHFILPYV